MSDTPVIDLKDIKRHFVMGDEVIRALDGVDLKIESGEYVAIIGPSGSGKSTMMNIIGCLDRPTEGDYFLDGHNVSEMTDSQQANIRNDKIGFVFQSFHLLPRYNAYDNIRLPILYSEQNQKHITPDSLLELVGLGTRMHHRPNELSGGQRQRVAIARALVNEPSLLLADEPTGNLDSKTSGEILDMLNQLHSRGVTIVLVTHDPEVADHASRVVRFLDGKIVSDEKKERLVKKSKELEGVKTEINTNSKFLSLVRLVQSGLWGSKLRTALSVLGVVIGVAAVIAMIGLGQGASARVTKSISTMGTNLLMIRAGGGRRGMVRGGNVKTLVLKDVFAIKDQVPGLSAVAPEASGQAQIKYFSKNENVGVIGTNSDYFLARNYQLDYGRQFTKAEEEGARQVCILGAETAQNLFEDTPAVGERIKVRGKSFEVIGVLKAKGQGGWSNPDDVVVVPVATSMKKLFGLRSIRAIYLSVTEKDDLSKVEKEVTQLLRHRHKLAEHEEDDFRIRNQEELLQTMGSVTQTFTLLLAGVAVVSLLVGGIGIMNIMLVSVTERTREIGLLKALGATRIDVMQQFLSEAMLICLAGGVGGILIGHLGAFLIEALTTWPVTIPIYAYFISFGFCVFIGVVFGAYPAWSASRLDPIEALRHE